MKSIYLFCYCRPSPLEPDRNLIGTLFYFYVLIYNLYLEYFALKNR